jgi:hypothetical protein
MRVEIPYVVLNKKGRPVEGADISVFKRQDYEASANIYGFSAATASGTTYTYYTDYPHDLVVGDVVTITGCVNSTFNVVSLPVTTIPTTSSFTVVGPSSLSGSTAVIDGLVSKTPISPIPLYTTAEGSTKVVNPQTDDFGRIEGWIEEGQYVVLIEGLNLTAVQYFEAVAGNTEVGAFTRAGVTLQPGSIKFGDNTIISATTGGDVNFEGNTDTNGYSTIFTSYPFTINPLDYTGDHYYGSNEDRNDLSLSNQNLYQITSPLTNLPTTGVVNVAPTQEVALLSATRTLNTSTSLYDYTFTTSEPHSLTVGTVVTISGAANLSYNGSFGITEVGSRTTFKVAGAPTDPGTNSGFTNGVATVDGQTYEINYFVKESPIVIGASGVTGMTISAGSLNTISGVPITGSVPHVGQGITITNYTTSAKIVPENTAIVESITETSTNVYTIVMSADAATAVANTTSLTLTFAEGIRFTDLVNTATTEFSGTSGNLYVSGSGNSALAGIGSGMGVSGETDATNAKIPKGTQVDYLQQTLTITATAGNYRIDFVKPTGTVTGSNLAYNASKATIQSELNTLVGSAGTVTVNGTGPYNIVIDVHTGGYFSVTSVSLTGGSAAFSNPYVYLTESLTGSFSTEILEFGHVFAVNNDAAGTWTKTRATLPVFTAASSKTVTSIFGYKNMGLAVENGATEEDIRVALNYLVEDLKKYGLIS